MPEYSLKTGDYLAADFHPEVVANALIRDTTTSQDTSVDVTPALTRLKYDLEEIEHQIQNICKQNTETLLDHSHAVSKTTSEVESLTPPLDDMISTYSKLERDFLKPYQKAEKLHSAGVKLHTTSQLCRNLSWYLQLALQAQSQDYSRETVMMAREAGSAMLRTARALDMLKNIVHEYPDLLRLNAVKRFEEKVPNLTAQLIEKATKLVNEYSGGEIDQTKLASMALITLHADLRQIVESHIKALVGTTVLQLSRNSSSPAGHSRAFGEAQDRETVARALSAVCNELIPAVAPLDGAQAYWNQVAVQLDQKLKTMSLANPATMKAFINNRENILTSTQAVESIHNVFQKYLNK